MNEQEIIESGILELYVSGSLPKNEESEIDDAVANSEVLRKEVEVIESSVITLAESVAPPLSARVWQFISDAINKVIPLRDKQDKTFNWASVSGWAAAILLLGGLLWMLNRNNTLNNSVELTTEENTTLKESLRNTETELADTKTVLDVIRSKEFNVVPLPGNPDVAPDAYAKIYYNQDTQVAYVDAKELPEPPQGKVYQVWSLIMEPLTPSSMGLLNELTEATEGLYKFENFPNAEGFGITLEPEGGSEAPTLTQLYTLGTVSQP